MVASRPDVPAVDPPRIGVLIEGVLESPPHRPIIADELAARRLRVTPAGELPEHVDGGAAVPHAEEPASRRSVADERELGAFGPLAKLVHESCQVLRRGEHGISKIDDDRLAGPLYSASRTGYARRPGA